MEVFVAPVDVILGPHDVFQPDLVVVRDSTQVSARGIEGPPLLVVEVLSPATRPQDRGTKARRYASFGVPHYWIVDPEEKVLECHRLGAGAAYEQVAGATGREVVRHPDWPDLQVRLGDLWR